MVLVSHSHQFIFLKTSKTAGTSVEMALEPACAAKGHVVNERTMAVVSDIGIIGRRRMPRKKPLFGKSIQKTWRNHKPASEVRRELGKDIFQKYTKITAVRNPFDRCVSVFHWRCREQLSATIDFDELRARFLNFIKNTSWKDDRNCVFIRNNYIIDRVVRFENMHQDLAEIGQDLGFEINTIPHTKSTKDARKNYAVADYYDAASIEFVRNRMAWVFERYDYPDTPVNRRAA